LTSSLVVVSGIGVGIVAGALSRHRGRQPRRAGARPVGRAAGSSRRRGEAIADDASITHTYPVRRAASPPRADRIVMSGE
jgi:hypothetical protein